MKKFISLCTVFSLLLSFQISTFAAFEEYFVTAEETVDMGSYYAYTVNLQIDSAIEGIQTKAIGDDDIKGNIEKAQDYVMSLDLSSVGYQHIESACLEQLDGLEQELETTKSSLLSYTVLVPKNRALTYGYYGAVNGRNFHSAYYSSYDLETEKKQYSGASKIQNWALSIINIALSIPGVSTQVTVPWTAISTLMGIPSNYTVRSNSYIKHYAMSRHNSRGIYWAKGNSEYKLVYTDESGFARLWFVFHPVDADYKPTYSIESNNVNIFSDNFLIRNIY